VSRAVRELFALDKLHHDKALVAFFADFVVRADVLMVERGCGFRFTNQTLDCVFIFGALRWKEFDCDPATELGVLR
jgi:hypothetical protein